MRRRTARVVAVLFDLDDTLADWQGAEATAILRLARHAREPEVPFVAAYDDVKQENFAAFRRDGKWWYLRDRLIRLQESMQREWEIDDMVANFVGTVRTELRLFPGALEALRMARDAGPVGILTNGPSHIQRPKIEALRLADEVDFVGITEELGHWKPKPEAFQAMLRKLDAAPGTSTMVGDSFEFDIQPARALGMKTIWIGGTPDRCDHAFADIAGVAAGLRARSLSL